MFIIYNHSLQSLAFELIHRSSRRRERFQNVILPLHQHGQRLDPFLSLSDSLVQAHVPLSQLLGRAAVLIIFQLFVVVTTEQDLPGAHGGSLWSVTHLVAIRLI